MTVYAEATILGDITIGKGAVIGGNVWIRESVPSGCRGCYRKTRIDVCDAEPKEELRDKKTELKR